MIAATFDELHKLAESLSCPFRFMRPDQDTYCIANKCQMWREEYFFKIPVKANAPRLCRGWCGVAGIAANEHDSCPENDDQSIDLSKFINDGKGLPPYNGQ